MRQWSKNHSVEAVFFFAMNKINFQTFVYTLFHLQTASYTTLNTLMKKVSKVVSCTCTCGYAWQGDPLVSLQLITGYVCQAVRCSVLNSRFLIWHQLRSEKI